MGPGWVTWNPPSFIRVRVGSLCVHFAPTLGPGRVTWDHFRLFGPGLGHFGASSRPLWAQFGSLGAHFGPFGSMLGHFGSTSRPLRALVTTLWIKKCGFSFWLVLCILRVFPKFGARARFENTAAPLARPGGPRAQDTIHGTILLTAGVHGRRRQMCSFSGRAPG